MRIKHATTDGWIIITEVPGDPVQAEPVEPTEASLESLAAAAQVDAGPVGMTEVEAAALVRSSRSSTPPDRA